MIESTARATRFETDPAPAPAYLWAPPQKPVSVSLPLTIIDRLEKEAVESFRSLSSRGSEIGGVLFGRVDNGSPLMVAIEGYDSVECDYAGGPLYRLGDAERARLDRAIEQRLAQGMKAIGFYRSHTRKGLYLDADDLALFDSRFAEPHHLALLIRPAATKVSMAGIFIRENGKVQPEASALEFPFRSSNHSGTQRADNMYDGAVAGPRSVAAAPAPPRPAIRAQIVPIASRREAAPETTLDSPAPAVADRVEPPAAPPPTPAAPAPVAAAPAPKPEPAPAPKVEPPASKPQPEAKKVEPAPAKAEPAAKTAEPKKETKPAPKAEAKPAAKAEEPVSAPAKSRKLLWITLGAAVPLVLVVGFFMTSGLLHRGTPTIPTAQDSSPLSLRVDRNGADLVLTWNRDSDAIRRATHAVLQINDGPQHENVDLDLSQLKTGSIQYTPATTDVVFRMEVSGSDQSKTQSESVRVLRTRPSPMPDGTTPEQAVKTTPAPAAPKTESASPAPAAETTPEPAPAQPQEEKVSLAQAVKPFKSESLAQRLRPAAPTASSDLPDAPVLRTPTSTGGVNLGALGTTTAPAAQTPSSPAPSAPAKVQQGGQIQQAQLLKRRDPDYPKLARDSGASGVVELVAMIGTDGHVKSVQVIKGHPLLRQAAADAVKSWIYRPTLLNGVPVESQTQVMLNFKGDR